jgi:hypothetical protein
MEIDMDRWWNDTGREKNKALGENPDPLPLCPP